ncbi:hypothetical protein J437_LFUL017566 [Ladona fulva]|uniref:Death domain-containing protein n=1 Tax=Ladona fulva TaxID=123851 RepID=A0A8K0P867_LADFU|nr:hypothetical protein J437_LFUL017566 [Ladona fulva]
MRNGESLKKRNPELEIIRDSVPGPPNIDVAIEELIRKTRDVDVSFLFSPEGRLILREICLALSSVKDNMLHYGWETFGHKLGLHPDVVKICGCCHNGQDPTYNVFLAYSKKENASLSKVIEALKPRKDVLNRTCDLLNALADEVHTNYGSSEESGYFSLSEGQSSSECSEEDVQLVMINSPYKETVPWIFEELNAIKAKDVDVNRRRIFYREDNPLQRAVPFVKKTPRKPNYGCKVMLTFTEDGFEAAKEVAKIMRRERDGLPRIGVVILQEQIDHLCRDPQEFISGAFNQVDYVIPIITEQYLDSITSMRQRNESNIDCIDANYVRYIYSLMGSHFVGSGCVRNKYRCIIPDDLTTSVIRHPLMLGPIFQVWVKVSETENLSVILLNSVLRRKLT